jgi:hypothetical protein
VRLVFAWLLCVGADGLRLAAAVSAVRCVSCGYWRRVLAGLLVSLGRPCGGGERGECLGPPFCGFSAATSSMEADIAFFDDPADVKADRVDGAIGEL